MIRLVLILLILATHSGAETARVYSGEHGGFTRLVIELPAATDWTLGRTAAGYAFAVTANAQPEYDLAAVWQRIAQTRLTALAADRDTGTLMLTLGCTCHVFPFEYRPGVVVLDIKPGPAPVGSAFEAAFEAPIAAGTAAPARPGGAQAAGYDWRTVLPQGAARHPVRTLPLPLVTAEVSLDPLHSALLEEIARGAADGVVDMRLTRPKSKTRPINPDMLPWSSIRIGEMPGIQVSDPDAFAKGTRPAATCAEDAIVDLGTWNDTRSPGDLLAEARSGLYGEFDAPDPEAVLRSVRLHLLLGFGAEAGQQAGLVAKGFEDETLSLYRSMARIIDGESDPDTPFAAMLDCDGPAALWAALARDRLPSGPGVNRDAILRAFLALPPHLRGHLGSPLAEKFLARDDFDAARVIRDAMERAPQADTVAVALLDAESDLYRGDAEAARGHAVKAVALDGNQARSLVALVETHFRTLEPVGSEVPEALLALRGETSGTDIADAVERAIILSLSLSGQTEAAFLQAGAGEETRADLWRVVQERASDDDFLRHAVLPSGARPPDIASGLDLAVARRLLSLGFPDAALAWIGPVLPTDPPERRLAAASAELGRGNARATIDLLAGLTDPDAETLRAEALLQLGDFPGAGASLVVAGQAEAAVRAGLWQGDWSNLDPATPEPWQAVARQLAPPKPDNAIGLLGRGARAVEASVAARAALEALLGVAPAPDSSGFR